jgi:hypothetical protein
VTPEAEAVRNAYRVRRQMQQPKWQGNNDRWQVCWQKAADFIANNELDLEVYVEAQFVYKAPFPMPNQLYSSEALKRYEMYRERVQDPEIEVIRRLELELGFLETRLEMGFSLEEILGFPEAPLTPLFCYCAAVIFERGDLAQLFEDVAKQQLARTPAARAIYFSLLSEGSDGKR